MRSPALGALAIGIGAVLAVAFIAPIHGELRYSVFPQDEGLLLVYPTMILQGAAPNHTFQSVYGVTDLWIIAAAFKLVGYSVTVERAVGIAYRAVILGSLVVLGWRHRGPLAAAVAGAICIVLLAGTLGLAAFAWMCALSFVAFAFLLLDLGLDHEMRRLPVAIAGACFGLAVGARLDMALGVLLVVVALLVYRRTCWRWLLLGIAVGLVPLVVNVIQAGPGAVIRDQLIEPIFVSGPARRLPLSNLSWEELALLVLCVVVAVCCVVVGIVLARRSRDEWTPVLLLTLGAFELGLLPQAFQRSDSLHIALVGCFVLPAAVLLPVWLLPGAVAKFNLVLVAFGIVVLALAAPYYWRIYWSAARPGAVQDHVHLVSNDGRSVPVASAQDQKDLIAVLHELEARARPGQRIFVGPLDLRTADYNDTFIYFLLPHLTPGSYYLEMDPGVANGKTSQLATDLGRDDFLILTSQYDYLVDPDPATRFGSNVPNEIVRRDFDAIETRGWWTLYQRRS